MLQSNRTVAEQGLSFWLWAALLWNSVKSHAISFAYRGPSRHLFLTIHVDTTGIIWDRGKNGLWQRSTGRYHRAAHQWRQEPNLESAC